MFRFEKCQHRDVSAKRYPCVECDSAVNDLFEPKKPTNAERIRSMSDEELAHFLMAGGMGSLFEKKIMNVKDWLQLEVEG